MNFPSIPDIEIDLLIFILSIVGGVLLGCLVTGALLSKRAHHAYLDGVQDGHNLETAHEVKTAVEEERLAVQRRLHDSGRRSMARPDAKPSVIHKAQIGPRRPGNTRG